jgi:putative PIN family toxin of toxin-antitoxin system
VKVVVDTNVLLSGLFYRGPSRQVYLAWTAGHFVGVVTAEILAEYRRVANRYLGTERDSEVEEALELILSNSEFIDAPPLQQAMCRDPDDNKFIACALHGEADYIVTGDKDLLALAGKLTVTILKPAQFVEKARKGA